MSHKEIEAKFLDIDKNNIINLLKNLKAEDLGEFLLKEVIFYDIDLNWVKEGKFVRIRTLNGKSIVSFKDHQEKTVDGTIEIEFKTDEPEEVELFLEKIGLVAFRHQEKYRHSFFLDNVKIDIDTWPKIPSYVELEGDSEKDIKIVAQKLGFDWNNAVFENAGLVIENRYGVKVLSMKWFTFDRIE
jgi:adenylate cyclase class 2